MNDRLAAARENLGIAQDLAESAKQFELDVTRQLFLENAVVKLRLAQEDVLASDLEGTAKQKMASDISDLIIQYNDAQRLIFARYTTVVGTLLAKLQDIVNQTYSAARAVALGAGQGIKEGVKNVTSGASILGGGMGMLALALVLFYLLKK